MRGSSAKQQIALLVLTNAFVGGMVGLERTLLPVLAQTEFGIASAAAATSFIITFGISKAIVNLFAGRLADAVGRRRVLIFGWLVGLPIPLVLAFAPSWSWIVAANVLLGVNQGLCWSMTLNLKLDHARPERRGLVVGLNETAGYVGVAVVALATGAIAASYGIRPWPFLLGILLVLAGLGLSFFARDARRDAPAPRRSLRLAFRDMRYAPMSAAGLATNLKDGALWGLLPIMLLARGFDLALVGLVVAIYPITWGFGQLVFGPLSDRIARAPLAVGGLALQAAGVLALALAATRPMLFGAAALTGIGTAMAYPTLLALVADTASAQVRATALGVYRFWRDAGYAIGAFGAGALADAFGARVALTAAACTLVSAGIWLLAAYLRRTVAVVK